MRTLGWVAARSHLHFSSLLGASAGKRRRCVAREQSAEEKREREWGTSQQWEERAETPRPDDS